MEECRTSLSLCYMDRVKQRSVLQNALKVLNQKEERDLQDKLNMLEKQYRCTRKMLQQRRRSMLNEEKRVIMLKSCEPKATVNIAMKDIQEHTMHCSRYIYTSDGGRLQSSKSVNVSAKGSSMAEQSRSISAPPASVNTVRHRGGVQNNLSLMQMKNIATIDSISERELARQQQKAQEEMELLRELQRETLHRRVTTFIEKLQDKNNAERDVEPP